jgi:hypothetical protein
MVEMSAAIFTVTVLVVAVLGAVAIALGVGLARGYVGRQIRPATFCGVCGARVGWLRKRCGRCGAPVG